MKLPFETVDEALTSLDYSKLAVKTEACSEPNLQQLRRPRFTRPLKNTGIKIKIPSNWEDLPRVSDSEHDSVFVEILSTSGLPTHSPVPLVTRYSKPRQWSAEELDACIEAHEKRIPIGLMSAALNRNPQDIIYRLLDVCNASDKAFREVGLGIARWTEKKKEVAKHLFNAGLTAWRIGALFGVDFEGVEKFVYVGRTDYGHAKRNPFAICTDHKQQINRQILERITFEPHVLDAFAGEGRFAAIVQELFPGASQICIEQSPETFERAQESKSWTARTRWVLGSNIQVMKQLASIGEKFDLIDLDPFVSCREQIDLAWPLLKDRSRLFVTFGGEYRRSFIKTNRLAIKQRYGFYNSILCNSEYLEIVPSFFLGWLSAQASRCGFVFEIEQCVRYPNNCRFWLQLTRQNTSTCEEWLRDRTQLQPNGMQWKELGIPRFSQLRKLLPTPKQRRDKTKSSLTIPNEEGQPYLDF
ncbi:MAG TPA: hypothetical protein VJR02_15260 [Pyrinomonadaceae bacterium]|nr:hypothetical protein [Pyrinomonadaceae bacterium]